MKVRDGHATINGDKTEYSIPSGTVEIIADDGRTLFSVHMQKDGAMAVRAGSVCKHGDKLLDDRLDIRPIASNAIEITRPAYPTKWPK